MSIIVVASDAPSVRSEVIADIAEPDDEIIELHEGRDVAKVVKEREPDLVVADLQMGSMGAVAVCMDLRLEHSYGNLPHVPVLILLDRRADVFLAQRSGAEGWVLKPLDPIRLRRGASTLMEGGTYHDRSFQPSPTVVRPQDVHPPGTPDEGATPQASEA